MANERIPVEARPPRMETLARLPLFFALDGKRALVAGGGPPSAWKAELLSAAGAAVDVYAEDPSEELLALVQDAPRGAIVLHRRRWEAVDFAGAAIAIGDCADEAEAGAFAVAARAAGVPVNVIDKPKFCDFAFGSIVNRTPLVIGISTDGGAPVFAQAVRAKIEGLIPLGFGRWAAAARRWREQVKNSGLSIAGRRRFWHVFTAFAVANPNRDPRAADYDRFLAQTEGEGAAVESGSVTLVGAGPGDPELLTLRAVRALQSADVILIDDLVSSQVLDFARREAKKMLVGKTGHGPACKQDEINALMISLAKAGKRVVRLKGGDPMIFGRGGEEVRACRTANIPIEVVPGISAAQAVAGRLGVSLTHRKHARRVQFITGHGEDGKLPDDLDWNSLGDATATTAVYMPLKTIGDLVARALAAGLDPATPAVAVARATRPDETVIAAPVAELPARLSAQAPGGPVLVLIGHVLADRAAESRDEWLGETPSAARF
jgi:uroporphyrin-III C-methyltransferase / precorrin-2 dehydrogenase / sirohydrochlorin ferrochelatase